MNCQKDQPLAGKTIAGSSRKGSVYDDMLDFGLRIADCGLRIADCGFVVSLRSIFFLLKWRNTSIQISMRNKSGVNY